MAMGNGNGNGNGSDPRFVAKVAESVWLVACARIFQVLVVPAIGTGLWLGIAWLGDLSKTAESTAAAVGEIKREQSQSSDSVAAIEKAQAKAAASIKQIELETRYQSARTGAIEKKLGIETPPRWWEEK